jgi:hypothetical protein
MYATVKTKFTKPDALIDALMETGNWTRSQIEVHGEAQHLYGYQGDVREQTAHVIVRRNFMVGAANDLGFVQEADGSFTALVSDYDSRQQCKPEWMASLKQNYAFHAIRRDQEGRGRRVSRERLPDGRQRVQVQVRGR